MFSVDSPGPSTLKTDAVLIFDLDNTILSVNSFPYWVLYMLTGRFPGLRPKERLALSWRAGQILFSRKVLRQSHFTTKYLLQALWSRSVEHDNTETAMHGLSNILQNYVRPNMHSLLATIKSGQIDAILTTSAAGEYAHGLGQALGFIHIITTPLCTDTDKEENCKERKRDRTLALIDTLGWTDRPRVFFTDHEEDLPLIKECNRALWFGRYEDTAVIQAQASQTRVIFARNVPDSEMRSLAGLL